MNYRTVFETLLSRKGHDWRDIFVSCDEKWESRWDLCVSVVAERGGIDAPDMEEAMNMTSVYTRIIGYLGYISLKVIQERLKITSPHLFENLFLEFGERLGR